MLIEVGKRYVLCNGFITDEMIGATRRGGSPDEICFAAKCRKDCGGIPTWYYFDHNGIVFDADESFDVHHQYNVPAFESQPHSESVLTPVIGKSFLMECGGTVVFTGQRDDGRLIGMVNLGAGLKYPEVFETNGTVVKSPGFRIVQEIGDGDIDATLSFDGDDAVAKKCESPEPKLRQFATGATRNLDTNKLDYDGFFCPLAMKRFAEYMHSHRMQKDGKMRDSDNWQNGIPFDVYIKSLFRHFMDLRLIHKGQPALSPEDNHSITADEALCAIIFNAQGYLHEFLKAQQKSDV